MSVTKKMAIPSSFPSLNCCSDILNRLSGNKTSMQGCEIIRRNIGICRPKYINHYKTVTCRVSLVIEKMTLCLKVSALHMFLFLCGGKKTVELRTKDSLHNAVSGNVKDGRV